MVQGKRLVQILIDRKLQNENGTSDDKRSRECKPSEYPDTPFLNFHDEIVTYRALDERTGGFAVCLLAKGVKKADAVSFMTTNSPHFFYTLLGAQRIGAMAVPINCWWQAPEVEFLVDESDPKALAVDPREL